ncbi:(S)-2-hydroxy-acid oxidase GLO1 [Selaginella moellendorffii]|uniref:(S)-2-hydroxy-acid oxidase GLO1 n=1 Tax=Selaginella moellendorffii TaxID=88036 RepID=UPI000D1C873A|nr:(S)-2-hydroxy-acid oxidase GLO1 [Selaginella moellendorffii]|eukprot:XP_024544857.1 (S)-2-hydroxy-acid oxidase GLO1 [Selaginella moellendorffii]
MARVVNVDEYEDLARVKMPKMHYDFYAGGAEDKWTLRENRSAFSRIRIRPQVLVDVSHTDLTTSVLGLEIACPIMVAPTALHKLAHPEGELATARATAAANTVMVVSTSSSHTIEEIADTGPGIRFFQLYIFNKVRAMELVARAEKAGYKAIVLTVDTPILGRREDDLRNRLVLPPDVSMKLIDDIGEQHSQPTEPGSSLAAVASEYKDKSITWKDVQAFMKLTKLPFLLKGILTKEDALKAIDICVDGIIVSNHGGRQLDHVPATISVLEEVVAAAAGRCPVFVDGGIRRGTDVFKALALGASGVFVGRPVLFGLAIDGEQGVKKVLDMLKDELRTTMVIAGCPTLAHINRSSVQTPEEKPSSKL